MRPGNKASGALGQAARESDSWENATGELKEAQRQLQAVLGKPVLKNTIPIIQKFTDKMNAAAKSGKLDDLAEGIGNTFGWLVDHGDDVVGAVAGIASGFIAFQATKKAGEIVQIATSFFRSPPPPRPPERRWLYLVRWPARLLGGLRQL